MKRYLLLPIVLLSVQSRAQQHQLIVGTYTNNGKSEGIYVYDFDAKTGETKQKSVAKGVENPSYLTLSPDKKFVYSVNEASANSAASAFGFNAPAGELKLLNKQAVGADPCYIIADKKNVITANYSGGSATVIGINPDGSLGAVKQEVKHSGKSVNAQRQNSPHVHMALFTPDHKFVLINDLGTDKIYIYQYNPESATQVLTLHKTVAVTPGAGPRHLTFSNNGKFVYLLQELDAGVAVFSYKDGSMHKIQETKLTDEGFAGENGAADIHISPDGKFLYASNRGSENNITIFSIANDGLISKTGQVSTLGKGPRNFVIDPSGKFLLVGHHQSNNVVVFERNAIDGSLKDTGKRIEVGAPVCLVFAPVN